MRDTCEYSDFKQGSFLASYGCMGNWRVFRDGMHCLASACTTCLDGQGSPVACVDHAAVWYRGIMHKVVFKGSSDCDGAFDKGEVCLADSLLRELPSHFRKSICASCHNHEPRGSRVYAVERSGHKRFVSYRGAFGESCAHEIHEGSRLPARERLHWHARRLVEGKEEIVLKAHGNGEGGVGRKLLRQYEVVALFEELPNPDP